MSQRPDGTSDSADAAPPPEQSGETRAAGTERSRAGIDRLVRFQVEAYKTRIAELKRLLARERAEKQALARELAALHERHRAMRRLLQRIDRRLEAEIEQRPEGEES